MKGAISLVELLHEVSGRPRAQLRAALAKTLGADSARARCPLHHLTLTKSPLGSVWKCTSCGWVPTELQLVAYEQGLAHGRANQSGGGRTR